MPLSEYEQRVLEQMERQLHAEDPKLADSMEHPTISRRGPWRYVVGALAVVVGLTLLLVGVSSSFVWLGIVGFVAMFLGVTFVVVPPRKIQVPLGVVDPETGNVRKSNGGSAKKSTSNGSKGGSASSASSSGAKKSFMGTLEDRWEKRRKERGL